MSLRRAVAVVKRQATVAFAVWRRVSPAAIVRRTVAGAARRRSKHGVDTTATAIAA